MLTGLLKIEGDAKGESPVTSPSQMAHSIAFGIVIGMMPKDNLLAVSCAALIFVLPIHRMSAIVTVAIVSILPWLTDPIAHQIGESFLKSHSLRGFWLWTLRQPMIPWFGINNTVVLGGMLLGAILYPANFLVCRTVLRQIHKLMLQEHIDELVGQAIEQNYLAQSLIVEKSGKAFRERRKEQMTVVAIEEIDFIPIVDDEPKKSVDPKVQTRAKTRRRFDNAIQRESQSPKLSSATSSNPPPSPSVQPAPSVQHPASSLPANFRIDIPENINPSKPAVVDTPFEYSNALEMVHTESTHHSEEESVVHDTVIEIVRFRANARNEDQVGNASSIPTPIPPIQLNKEIMPDQLIAKLSTDTKTKPAISTSSIGSAPSDNRIEKGPTSQNSEPTTATFHPAEESLRFLLWHLNSANREQRE